MNSQNLSIHFRLPPGDLFRWDLESAPETLPPPPTKSTWVQPFPIPESIFYGSLDKRVPITAVVIYLMAVTALNRANRHRNYAPWKFSQAFTFKWLVIFHNIILAVFSAWTFYGMCSSVKSISPWNAGSTLSAQVVDFLCHIISQDETPSLNTSQGGTFSGNEYFSVRPNSDRLWSNGYAYFFWLFYMSKYYEVFDTFIILAKGKQSSILQTYHHAGVMVCMWAGVKYMSPPGIVGVFFNSAIHTMMYTYFAWTALDLSVSRLVKQTLTTLQIAQFVIGLVSSCSFMFIEYETIVFNHEEPIVAGGTEKVDISSRFREGDFQVQRTPCLRHSSEVFPLLLTSFYLLPLIYLFASFFSRSYLNQPKHAKIHEK
ncbi:fatty acid elongase-like protein [Penicillium verhagenii]|nr:fatty acid elongase-like protein [Penicillium verhagenii]